VNSSNDLKEGKSAMGISEKDSFLITRKGRGLDKECFSD
jgi:hypothetical protein